MDDYVLLLLIAVVLFFTIVPYSVQRILELRQAKQQSNPLSHTVENAIIVGINALVYQGKLEEAIEAYRDYYQINQRKAKDAITKIQRSQQNNSESSISRNAVGGIIRLVKEGKINVALKLYQEVTRSDLQTAQKAIAQIQQANLDKS